jgi:hypothetical protein
MYSINAIIYDHNNKNFINMEYYIEKKINYVFILGAIKNNKSLS